MESLFFNTPNQCYKISKVIDTKKDIIEQVDISNGALFFDINLKESKKRLEFNYIDKMLFIAIVKDGSAIFVSGSKKEIIAKDNIATFINVDTPFEINIKKESRVFILFIADFFLKRYLTFKLDEPIDYIYSKLQNSNKLLMLNQTPLDAFSNYLANKIISTKECANMQSIKCMYRSLEFIVHNLNMLDIIDNKVALDDQKIAKIAKDILLSNYAQPPTIKTLAKMCATNECKLKKAFKAVYKTTIYAYIQRLRLERANLLLKEDTLSIKEVANSVGYRHSGYFAKLFFKTYGVYPKDII